MFWLEIFGWFVAFTAATNLCYRKGVRSGIKHAIMVLDLDQYQTDRLNKELKKDNRELSNEMLKI